MQNKHWKEKIYKGGGVGFGPMTTEYLEEGFYFALYFS